MFDAIVANWLLVILSWIFVFAPAILVGVFIIKRTSCPTAFAGSKYVRSLKMKMAISIAVPVTLMWLVLVLAYSIGGYGGLILVLIVPLYVLIKFVLTIRSQKIPYSVSTSQSPGLHKLLSETAKDVGIDKPVEIGLCPGVNAYTFGWLKPKIVFGLPLFDHLTVDEIKSILAHELGHVKNRDYAFSNFLNLVNSSIETAFEWGKRLLGFGVNIVHGIIVGLAIESLGESLASLVGWIVDVFAKIFMAIVTAWLWVCKTLFRLVTLLFDRQGEFLADLHTTPFETEGRPANFKRGLGRISLMMAAENDFHKEVVGQRIEAVQKGKFAASDLYDRPHLNRFYRWMQRAGFEPSERMIDSEIVQKKPSIVERLSSWGHTHPLTGDRIRNLEKLMLEIPVPKKEGSTEKTGQPARVLIEGIYEDAVEALYGSEKTDEMVQ